MTVPHANKASLTLGQRHLVCLAYHDVVPDGWSCERLSPSVTSYFVELSRFRAQMERLAAGSTAWSLEQVKQWLADGRRQQVRSGREKLGLSRRATKAWRPAVHLTFDDGWSGSVYRAGPVLQELGLSATLFVTTGLVGQPGFVSAKTLRELDPNLFQLGAHGHTHRLLNQLPRSAVRAELAESKRRLEDWTGRPVDALALPGGAGSRDVLELAAEVGYRYVFGSRPAVNRPGASPLDVARVAVKRNTRPADFERYLQGRLAREAWTRRLRAGLRRLFGHWLYERLRRGCLGEKRGQLEMTDLLATQLSAGGEVTADSGPAQQDQSVLDGKERENAGVV